MKFRFKKRDNVNIGRVVSKVAITLIALWAGGTIVNVLGTTMTCTESPFYTGLSLIGWTITNGINLTNHACNLTSLGISGAVLHNNVITATTGTGILGVIGLIAIASIVMEFVQVRMA